MVNELEQLLRENVASPPPDHLDVGAVVRTGRGRVRRRRAAVVGGTAAVVTGVLVAGTLVTGGDGGPDAADRELEPVGRVLTLAEARPAVPGEDFRVLASQTNEDLDQANGRYLSGVTDDGLVLVTDGPHTIRNETRIGLLTPGEEEPAWLPGGPQQVEQPIALREDRLVFRAQLRGLRDLSVRVFDRTTGTWSSMSWPSLPRQEVFGGPLEHDGRLYLGLDTGGEIEQTDLWSVSLTDPADVRDERTVVGDFAIGGGELAWTDRTNGPVDTVTVRDLATGEERSFDPRSGDRCNQLGLQRVDDLLVLGQYCGERDDVRDDRVQVVTTDGEPVVTVRGDGVEAGWAGGSAVLVTGYGREDAGTYAFLPDSGELVRLGDGPSSYSVGGRVPEDSDLALWHTAVNRRHGATQWLAELL